MSESSILYAGVFRALLTEEALDRAGRKNNRNGDEVIAEFERLVGISSLDDVAVNQARSMAVVYTAIAAFENTVRDFISKIMLEEKGANWWEECVSEKIRAQARKRHEDEAKIKWHTQRGSDPIQYTMLPNLLNIIRQNEACFIDFFPDPDWVASVFDTIERSRNVIMHSGLLTKRDVARLGSVLRDWNAQVAI